MKPYDAALFKKYRKVLTLFANTKFGRQYLCIPKDARKIVYIGPAGYTEEYQGYKFTTVKGYPKMTFALGRALSLLDIACTWNEKFVIDFNALLHYLNLKFNFSKYPLIALDDITVQGAAGANSPVDGLTIRSNVDEAFATIRVGNGTGNFPSQTAQGFDYLLASTTSNQYAAMYRFHCMFDVSSHVPDTDLVSAGTLSFYGDLGTSSGLGNLDISLVQSTAASTGTLVNSDYGNTGTTRLAIDFSGASWNSNAYNAMILNSDGCRNVSSTVVSQFATRCANDFNNSAPTWASGLDSYHEIYTADQTGTANDPKLAISHLPAQSYLGKMY